MRRHRPPAPVPLREGPPAGRPGGSLETAVAPGGGGGLGIALGGGESSGWDRAVEADVLVIGAGAAGLSTALGCVPRRVIVLTKTRLNANGGGGASVWAQGGVASALGDDDNPALHAADTLAAGAGLNDAGIVRLLTGEGPARIRSLLAMGARFDRDAGGRLALGREAAHSRRRILHAHGDATGAEVVRTLVEAVRHDSSIAVVDEAFALDLVMEGGAVAGVTARHRDGRQVAYRAPAVVLATGGLGQLYLYTTNPREATADGLAMAARAGARLVDLEFVQFHPTALAVERPSPDAPAAAGGEAGGPRRHPANPSDAADSANIANIARTGWGAGALLGGAPLPLLTEALRGEGAVLIDDRGERFMTGVHPDRELAPRDVVARAIWHRLEEGRRVFLDARKAVGERFPERFPTVFALCREHGIDPRAEPMPVVPAAHYHMGGVAVDASGRTSLPGLWACGEVAATGAHGANRLASNSLLEALVFGARVAEDIVQAGSAGSRDTVCHEAAEPGATAGAPGAAELSAAPGTLDESALVARVRRILWERVGVERDGAGLAAAAAELRELARQPAARVASEARNMLLAGRLVTAAALARRESRGGHFRTDFPCPDIAWQRRLFLTVGGGPDAGEARFEPAPAAERPSTSAPGTTAERATPAEAGAAPAAERPARTAGVPRPAAAATAEPVAAAAGAAGRRLEP